MVLASKRIQKQVPVCVLCWEPIEIEQEWKAEIKDTEEPEVEYFSLDIECEVCAFGLE